MLSLAAFRYRNVLAEFGGPVERMEMGKLPVRGRTLALANASLKQGLAVRRERALFSATADGSGVHEVASIARHIAISEAMERWAFSSVARSDSAARYGFDVDPSTCGMSAYPGLLPSQARRRSVLESIERFSLINWWEGRVDACAFDTDWPGISALAIESPLGGITVIVYARSQWGGYVYGHAADESFTGACERAIHELARHDWVLRFRWLADVAGARLTPTGVFERRCVFFASQEGFDLFQARIKRHAWASPVRPEVICDSAIPGPWSDYATVWRFALRPPSDRFLRDGDQFFFF